MNEGVAILRIATIGETATDVVRECLTGSLKTYLALLHSAPHPGRLRFFSSEDKARYMRFLEAWVHAVSTASMGTAEKWTLISSIIDETNRLGQTQRLIQQHTSTDGQLASIVQRVARQLDNGSTSRNAPIQRVSFRPSQTACRRDRDQLTSDCLRRLLRNNVVPLCRAIGAYQV